MMLLLAFDAFGNIPMEARTAVWDKQDIREELDAFRWITTEVHAVVSRAAGSMQDWWGWTVAGL